MTVHNVQKWAYETLRPKFLKDPRVISVHEEIIEADDIDLAQFKENPDGATILVEGRVDGQVFTARRHRFDHVTLRISVKSFNSQNANDLLNEIHSFLQEYNFQLRARKEWKDIDEHQKGSGIQIVLAEYENFRFNGVPYLRDKGGGR